MNKFIRHLSLFMSFVLLISTLSVLTTIHASSATIKIGYISGTSVNVRQNASTTSSSVDKVSNFYVTVLESKNDTNSKINSSTNKIYVWYKVTYTKSSTTYTGYVREDLIKVSEYTIDSNFVKKLQAFPSSYHDDLIKLHAIYPQWEFVADTVPTTFSQAVTSQDYLFYKLIQTDYNSWCSMRKGCYNWSTNRFVETDSGGWYGASREVIAYYMDPRNFLNANDIYVYLKQSYDENSQTVDGVEEIVKGTFLDATITDSNDKNKGKRYAVVIKEAGKQSSVNPFVLASTIIQEQGRDGSTLSKGTTYNGKTVYNFFNFGASGSNQSQVLENGKKYAYDQKWYTPTDSIVNGAIKYGTNYISIGQDTYFYKNYNVLNPDKLWHQYAQNVADSLNSSKFLKNAYSQNYNMKLTFRIPVFKSLPTAISQLPAKNNKLNNYYFSDIQAEGLTPSFDRYTYEYSLSVDADASISLSVHTGAAYTGASEFSLKKGNNTVNLVVQSQTGYTNTYVVNVYAQKACKLYVNANNSGSAPSGGSVAKGDTNGDGKISTSDLANVKLHLLKLVTLKNNSFKGADTNGDGKISTSDLANIKLHLLGLIKLK